MNAATVRPDASHPVVLDIEYPERLSRWLIFVRWLLVIPHLFIIWILGIVLWVITVLAWFGLLFSGRYPRSFFDFTTGVMRWQSNIFAYSLHLTDRYPPFSLERTDYALDLEIPPAERQSRWRLFFRPLATLPNLLVLYLVTLGLLFTTFMAWWAILFTGRYPRGLFKFAEGTMRWQARLVAYALMLRDEYPPYSLAREARPGPEAVSFVLGVPLGPSLWLPMILLFAGFIGTEQTYVTVDMAALTAPGGGAEERPSGRANTTRMTLLGYDDDAHPPPGIGDELPAGHRHVAFDFLVEKDGFWPAWYVPTNFVLDDCVEEYDIDGPATLASGPQTTVFVRSGSAHGRVYFIIPSSREPCTLTYQVGAAAIIFEFY